MEVSTQPQTLKALALGKEHPVLTDQEIGLGLRVGVKVAENRKETSPPMGNRTPM